MGNEIEIIERFNGIQGEGFWAGTPMFFIRLPHCNCRSTDGLCSTWDGRKFFCDTDLESPPVKIDVRELLSECHEHHICITGGEPFHPRNILSVEEILKIAKPFRMIHFETNGTMPIPFNCQQHYIACSPKAGFYIENIFHIDEYRFLVDQKFDEELIPQALRISDRVYLSPIADGSHMNKANLEKAIEVLDKHPEWKLSLQMHKYWGVR